MMKHLGLIFIVVSIILATSLFTAFPSFKLALFGDDWQQLYNYFHYLGPEAGVIKHLTFFIGGYGSFEVMTGILFRLFGNDYKMYYIFAYLYRLIAVFSLWPLTFYLTGSKLAAFYAIFFLSVTIIGMESTNWVINSPVYLGVAFLSLFLYFYIKSREDLKIKTFLFSLLFFYLTHIFALIRVTGLLPFTFLLEFSLNLKSPNIKLSLKRLLLIIISFVIIANTSQAAEGAGSLAKNSSTIIASGLSSISTHLKEGQTDFLFYPIMTLGRLIIPNSISFQIPILLLTLIIFICVLNFNIPNGKKVSLFFLIGLIIWNIISWIIYLINQSTLLVNDALSLTIGGYVITLGMILLYFNRRNMFSILFFIGIFWTVFSFFFPWIRAPETLHPTEHRYLVASGVGIAILLSGIVGLGQKLKNRINLFLLVIPLLLIHLFSTRSFFKNVVTNSHGAESINKMWSTLPYIPQMDKTEKPLIFYFDSSPDRQNLKHHSLSFGFPYKIAMIYNIYDSDIYKSISRMPIAINDWNEIVSAVSDGKSMVSRGFSKKPIPINNVYAFFLNSDDTLTDITKESRNKLEELIKNQIP